LDGEDSNAIVKKYTWGLDVSGSLQGAGGVGGLLACEDLKDVTDPNDDVQYVYAYDGNGNVMALTDSAQNPSTFVYDGTELARYDYDPFGNVLTATGAEADANRYRFSTKPQDAVTELFYYGYRWYHADWGRWISRDPIEEDGGTNIYQFALGSPTGLVDILGMESVSVPVVANQPTPTSTPAGGGAGSGGSGQSTDSETAAKLCKGEWKVAFDGPSVSPASSSEWVRGREYWHWVSRRDYYRNVYSWEEVASTDVPCCLSKEYPANVLEFSVSKSEMINRTKEITVNLGIGGGGTSTSVTEGTTLTTVLRFPYGPFPANVDVEYKIFLLAERREVYWKQVWKTQFNNPNNTAPDWVSPNCKCHYCFPNGCRGTLIKSGYTGKSAGVICYKTCERNKK